MKVRSLGTGGAFDKVSSSFIIESNEYKILFDAGHGIFDILKESGEISDITEIFISHTHFDHIGELERIIFYRFFFLNKPTKVIAGEKVIDRLNDIFKNTFNTVYENGKLNPVNMCTFNVISKETTEFLRFINENTILNVIEVNHIATPCYGLQIKEYSEDSSNYNSIIISGDTKASINIKNEMIRLVNDDTCKKVVVLHDFSNWDNPFNNIHCCQSDFDFYYKDILNISDKINFIKYHDNGDPISISI